MIFSHLLFQVSLVLEPLPELYDTSSSVPTTEGSLDAAAAAQGSSKSQLPAPSQQPRHTQVTVADQESVDNSKATTLRYLFFPRDKIVVYFAVHTNFYSNVCTLVSYGMLDLFKHTFYMKSRMLRVSKVTGTISCLIEICILR